MTIRRIVFLLILSLLLFGCKGLGHPDPLAGTKWKLVLLNGQDLVAGSVITLEFNDDTMSGSSGCNSYAGGYKVQGDRLVIKAIGMTEMACVEEGLMTQEAQFAEGFSKMQSYRISEGTLELIGSGGDILMRFSSAE